MSTEMNETNRGLRVVKLSAENYKRLSAVEITPDLDAATVTIAGRNAQGKSSVLDAIWAALSNTAAARGTTTTRPIRDGEKTARVTVDLGDIIVTRKWEGDKNTLIVESADGARFPSPQKMLDDLIGRLSFDPLAFASLPAKAQQAELLNLVELPFNPVELAAKRKGLFDQRADIGREGKQLKGQLDGYPLPAADLPETELSVSQLVSELRAAQGQEQARVDAERGAERAARVIAEAEETLKIARRDLEVAQERLTGLPEMRDLAASLSAIETQIDNAESINNSVRTEAERKRIEEKSNAKRVEYKSLTSQLEQLDKSKSEALSNAKFPVDGLGFDDDGVTYNGVPFAQASSAERLRVSVAMAMALNPKIRVIRIADGSLLDSENLAVIEAMAAEQGFQVWIEVVDETGAIGVVIEDGAVKE
ncbi:AAA family ATPase [Rhodococcus sp. GOMB7]|uniref:AAA family ATPase n=1 Tax=Rhodococcus sp. GOMB7 TaxID=2839033 RepID=UPI001C003C9C|nr:AAA family ATPase [Rhodococcus sp. GOMB7]MBT9295368.1 AAA family ATPase [Rhodococcus sp. GOMB7]